MKIEERIAITRALEPYLPKAKEYYIKENQLTGYYKL